MAAEQLSRHRIVVGIDGSRSSRYAVFWAAREARIRHCQLLIAHVAPTEISLAIGGAQRAGEPARTILELTAAAASTREPGIPIGTLLLHGRVSDQLVELSRSALLLVLGVDTAVPRPAHGVLGPVEDRIVAQAQCPVVTINGPLAETERTHPTVAVGWVDNQTGRRALGMAAAEAEAHGGSLSIVFATPTADGAPAYALPREDDASLHAVLAGLADTYPGVPIDVVHARAEPAEALLRHSAGADLLVIGSYHTDDRFSIRIGPVGTETIRRASCPVMLVGRLAERSHNGEAILTT
jgi:nucleotide-binding universal stress UspA family protein